MKLYISPSSPFARKVRIVAHEKGLADQVEEIIVDPYANPAELADTNPMFQVPTLIAKDGQALTDSPVIAQYLDQLGRGPVLLPIDPAEWLEVKRRETLGNQALEMRVKWVLEKRRPESERSPSWIERWSTNLGRALDALEAADQSAERLDMGVITAGCVLAWLNLRHPDYDWKTGRPKLIALHEALEQRDSFKTTVPV